MSGDTLAQLIYLVVLLVAVGGWVLVEYRGRMGAALRTALAWGLIIIGLMAGYGLWADLRRGIPGAQTTGVHETGADFVALPRADDGHYYANLRVNGAALTALIDTGATQVVLPKAIARDLGYDVENLAYIGMAETANGPVRTARITLENVTFGPFTDAQITAYVSEGEMSGALLGMTYLSQYDITLQGDKMLLRR